LWGENDKAINEKMGMDRRRKRELGERCEDKEEEEEEEKRRIREEKPKAEGMAE